MAEPFSISAFSSSVRAIDLSLATSASRPCRKRAWRYWMGVDVTWSSRWWSDCCATYERRNAWCFHISPCPSSGSRSPMRSLRKVDLPEPLPPTITAREPSVTVASTSLRMYRSVSGYLKEHFLRVITGLRNVRIPSGLPGSGKFIGRMRPAAIISSTFARVVESPEPSDAFDSETDTDDIDSDSSDTSSEPDTSDAGCDADFGGPLSMRGRPAAISGLSFWKSEKDIG
mmetsp:Transcript_2295/g.7108  ORF Transcript_2295/g.7108 Transcript_2295/m.7108 type:complete len:229 (-) Transcript_2295:2238-2924(-)